jgi:hypothetical protein
MPTTYIGNWSDEFSNVRSLARTLRANGIKAKVENSSPYVGHVMLKVAEQDVPAAKRYLKLIGEDYIANECFKS